MTAPLALQLHTVRQALAQDFARVVRHIADIGYIGVEPIFHLPGATVADAARLFQELGLAVPGAHTPLPIGEDKNKVLDYMATLGSKRIVSGKGPESFQTPDLIKRTCDLFNEAHAVAAENGMEFGLHNHWWEFAQIEGQYVYHLLLEHLDPGIFFEVDTYWVKTAGIDPAQVVRELGPRAPLLHIKDGPAVQGAPHVAVGQGTLNFPRIIQAGAGTVQWLVVELDRCAGDMMKAVEQSYHYLVTRGLARGARS